MLKQLTTDKLKQVEEFSTAITIAMALIKQAQEAAKKVVKEVALLDDL